MAVGCSFNFPVCSKINFSIASRPKGNNSNWRCLKLEALEVQPRSSRAKRVQCGSMLNIVELYHPCSATRFFHHHKQLQSTTITATIACVLFEWLVLHGLLFMCNAPLRIEGKCEHTTSSIRMKWLRKERQILSLSTSRRWWWSTIISADNRVYNDVATSTYIRWMLRVLCTLVQAE